VGSEAFEYSDQRGSSLTFTFTTMCFNQVKMKKTAVNTTNSIIPIVGGGFVLD
jgi:hypothetical protein